MVQVLSWFYTQPQSLYSSRSRMRISIFYGISVYPIDWYQNAIPRAMSLHELKQVQLQECVTLMTQDSIGHENSLHEPFITKRWC